MKTINKYYKVKKCIICLKKATSFSGNLKDLKGNKRIIISGRCKEHFNINIPDFMNKMYCHGAWHSMYGIQKYG